MSQMSYKAYLFWHRAYLLFIIYVNLEFNWVAWNFPDR